LQAIQHAPPPLVSFVGSDLRWLCSPGMDKAPHQVPRSLAACGSLAGRYLLKCCQPQCCLTEKPCKSAAFRGRSLFTGPITAGVRSLLRRSSPPKLLDGAYVARDRRSSWHPLVCRGAGLAPTPFQCWRETRGRIWASSRAKGDLEQGSHAGDFSRPSRPEPPWSHFPAPLVASRACAPGRPPHPRDLDRRGLSAHARISVRPPSR
jgi:hypothetical protein